MAGSSRADYRFGQQIPDPQNFALGDTVGLFPSLNLHYARNYGAALASRRIAAAGSAGSLPGLR